MQLAAFLVRIMRPVQRLEPRAQIRSPHDYDFAELPVHLNISKGSFLMDWILQLFEMSGIGIVPLSGATGTGVTVIVIIR
jgi:hypothetical protein